MAQGRSARLACAAERTNGELCATAWNRRLFSDGGGGGGGGVVVVVEVVVVA
jgi:hypothetical protein